VGRSVLSPFTKGSSADSSGLVGASTCCRGEWIWDNGVLSPIALLGRIGYGGLVNGGNAQIEWHHSADVRAKRYMIALNIGSFIFFAACEAETHLTSRWRLSGQCLFWLLTFSGRHVLRKSRRGRS